MPILYLAFILPHSHEGVEVSGSLPYSVNTFC